MTTDDHRNEHDDDGVEALLIEASTRYGQLAPLNGPLNVEAARNIGIGLARDHPPERITKAWNLALELSNYNALAVLGWANTFSRSSDDHEAAFAALCAAEEAEVLDRYHRTGRVEDETRARQQAISHLIVYTAADLQRAHDHFTTHGYLNAEALTRPVTLAMHDQKRNAVIALELITTALAMIGPASE